MIVFVDTSVWFAAADANDRSNVRAKSILKSADRLCLSDFVLLETWLLLRNKLSWEAAESFVQAVRSGAAQLDYINAVDLEAAHAVGLQYANQEFSLTDRTSFAIMERLGVTRVASLDADFLIYRYGRDRRKAFEVLS